MMKRKILILLAILIALGILLFLIVIPKEETDFVIEASLYTPNPAELKALPKVDLFPRDQYLLAHVEKIREGQFKYPEGSDVLISVGSTTYGRLSGKVNGDIFTIEARHTVDSDPPGRGIMLAPTCRRRTIRL